MSYIFTKTAILYDISTKSPHNASEKRAVSEISPPNTSIHISLHNSSSFYILQPQQLELKINKLPFMLILPAFVIRKIIKKKSGD
jgi:hypothetical protein